MARRRFLVDRVLNDTAELRGDDAHHLARVLRAEPGQQYEISDGAGGYLAEISVVEKDRVSFHVLESLAAPPEPVRLTLIASLIKFDRFEWLVEKATELGVAAIVPANATRTERGLLEASGKRVIRWRRIAHESSQQARRVGSPEIRDAQKLGKVLEERSGEGYFLDERPGAPPLLTVLSAGERSASDGIALITGPEGGWTDAERDAAAASGWTAVSLGPLILRAETAAVTAAGLLMHVSWASQLK